MTQQPPRAIPEVTEDERPREPGRGPVHELHSELSGLDRLTAGAGRIGLALAIPILTFIALFLTFDFLRDQEASKLVQVIVALIVGIFGIVILYTAANFVVDTLPGHYRETVRPWVFVGPALVAMWTYLVYPSLATIVVAFQDSDSENFVGFDNFVYALTSETMLTAFRNTLGWLIVVPFFSVAFGLAVAVMADKLKRGESAVKSMVFLPMAISFVGASVVWKFVYAFRPEGFGDQIGLLNGIWVGLGGNPQSWLLNEPVVNNFLLMVILIWLQAGFAMVLISAAIKSVDESILEAARIDGATEWQAFWRVTVPSIRSTIVVVFTTITILVLKVFDIVWVMTSGEFGTEVIAFRMVKEFFALGEFGRGAAIAVVLFIAVIPVMILNVRRFQEQEATR